MILHWAWILWIRGGDIAAVICCIWAFWRGGLVERYGASIIGLCWILTALTTSHRGHGPGSQVVIIDFAALALFLVLAVWSRRMWVFFAAACQANAVASHFIEGISNKFGIYGYVTALGLWGGWALLICLAAGVIGYQQKLKRERSSS